MKPASLTVLQMAALTLACARGLGEFAWLQGWRLRDRLSPRKPV
jgi:hypothetical protein